MRTFRYILYSCFVGLLIGCGTVENNAWTTGVAKEDAFEIRQIVQAAHPGCKIYAYQPYDSDTIMCSTSCTTYRLHRTRHGWKLIGEAVIVT